MKTNYLALSLFCVGLSLASYSSLAGVKEGGGANSLNGKLVENYLVDIKSETAYRNTVAPLFEKLQAINPEVGERLSLVKYIREHAESLSWYFIPAELKPLSSTVTGLDFPSDQVAVQTSAGEVWVDQTSFHASSETEQAKLIVHEFVLRAALDFNDSYYRGPFKLDQNGVMKETRLTVAFFFDPRTLSLTSDQLFSAFGYLSWGGSSGFPRYPDFEKLKQQ